MKNLLKRAFVVMMVCVFIGTCAASGETVEAAGLRKVVCKTGLIVRAQPDKHARIIRILPKGMVVRVDGELPEDASWYHIVSPVSGYILAGNTYTVPCI